MNLRTPYIQIID